MRYFLELSYKGTNYHGWQIQPNAVTVQSVIEGALKTYLKEETSIMGSGRTDTGVHASFQVAHFDTEKAIDFTSFIRSINGILPADIAIYDVKKVVDEAHARFDAIKRGYIYKISPRKTPFQKDEITVFNRPIDIDKMNLACKELFQHTDFECFSKVHTDVKTFDCTITKAEWVITSRGEYHFHIEANRFLRGMVRAIVGTLLMVGEGKITLDEFKSIILSKDRKKAGGSAPSQGLFLSKVEYPDTIYA